MKFALASATFLAAVFLTAKADPVQTPNFEAQYKQLADLLDQAAKKFEELSGLKTQFDKEKFLNFLKSTTSQLTEQFKDLTEKLQKDSKAVPEELKKKYEEFVKQIQETIKGLNSPEVQEKTKKFQETLNVSVKKIGESAAELSKSFGLALPANIQKTLNEIFAELQKSAQTLQEKSQKILEGIQEELKKKKAA